MKTTQIATGVACLLFPFAAIAIEATKVWSGLTVPWSIEFTSPTTLYVSERNGEVWQLNLETKEQLSLGKPNEVYAAGQGGLLDLGLSNIDRTKLYLTYSKNTKQGATTALAMFDTNAPSNGWRDLFVGNTVGDGGRHFGSRLLIDEQYLYFTVGDRGERDSAQDLTSHNGTVLRLNRQGEADGAATLPSNALPAIYSFGHRNPQGITFGPDKQIWLIEHGPRGGDEINLVNAGSNYGWPVTSHGKEYWGPFSVGDGETKPGIESPKLVYVPSIAPSSLVYYSGSRYPTLKNRFLAGALKLTHINVVSFEGDKLVEEARLFGGLKQRIRDITISPDDYLYFTTDSGDIYRVER